MKERKKKKEKRKKKERKKVEEIKERIINQRENINEKLVEIN